MNGATLHGPVSLQRYAFTRIDVRESERFPLSCAQKPGVSISTRQFPRLTRRARFDVKRKWTCHTGLEVIDHGLVSNGSTHTAPKPRTPDMVQEFGVRFTGAI